MKTSSNQYLNPFLSLTINNPFPECWLHKNIIDFWLNNFWSNLIQFTWYHLKHISQAGCGIISPFSSSSSLTTFPHTPHTHVVSSNNALFWFPLSCLLETKQVRCGRYCAKKCANKLVGLNSYYIACWYYNLLESISIFYNSANWHDYCIRKE